MSDGQPNLMSRTRRKHHTVRILEEVLGDERLSDTRWSLLSFRFLTSSRGRSFGNTGYAYDDKSNWWALALAAPRLRDPVLSFVKESYGEIPESVCSVLLQYQRTTGQALLTIEKEMPRSWPIGQDTAREAAMALRPDFMLHS